MELYTNIQKVVDLCYVSLAQVELSQNCLLCIVPGYHEVSATFFLSSEGQST